MLQIHVVVVCGCVMKVIEGFVCVCSGWKGLHSKKAGKSVTLQFRNKINILVFHFYPLLTAAASELLILWRGAKTYMCNASQVVDMSRMPLAIDAFFWQTVFDHSASPLSKDKGNLWQKGTKVICLWNICRLSEWLFRNIPDSMWGK